MFIFKGLDIVTLDGIGLFVKLQRQPAFPASFKRELTPEVRLLQENSFGDRINSIFPLYSVKSGLLLVHQTATTGTVILNLIWYSMQITTYANSVSFLPCVFLQIVVCVLKWDCDMLIAFFVFGGFFLLESIQVMLNGVRYPRT